MLPDDPAEEEEEELWVRSWSFGSTKNNLFSTKAALKKAKNAVLNKASCRSSIERDRTTPTPDTRTHTQQLDTNGFSH